MAIYEIEDPKTGKLYELDSPELPSAKAINGLLDIVRTSAISEEQNRVQQGGAAVGDTGFQFGGGASRGAGASGDIPYRSAYEQLDIEQHPVLGRIQDIAGQAGVGATQGLTGGLAQPALRKFAGEEFPEPATTTGKIVRAGTGILGTAAGVVGKAALGGARLVGKATSSLVAKGAGAGIAGGLAVTPDTDTGEMLQIGKRLTNSLIGGALGGGIGVAARGLGTVKNLVLQTKFANKIIGEYNHVMNQASQKFGAAIDQYAKIFPKQRVDLSKAVTGAKDMLDDSPGLRTTIKRFPKLNEIFKDPNKAKSLTLKEAQDIKNSIKYIRNPRPEDLPINDLKNAITKSQLDAFPQFKDQLTEYAQISKDYDLLNTMVKDGKVIGAVKRGFGDAQVKEAVNRVFGKEMVAEMGGVENATKVARGAWRYGRWYLLYKVFKGAAGSYE